jgi:hypothetical protein
VVKKTLRLYVNDPMGKRCMMNMQAAQRLREELGLEIFVIKKTSEEYAKEKDPPPCPSVAVDERFVVRDGVIVYDELKAEIQDK